VRPLNTRCWPNCVGRNPAQIISSPAAMQHIPVTRYSNDRRQSESGHSQERRSMSIDPLQSLAVMKSRRSHLLKIRPSQRIAIHVCRALSDLLAKEQHRLRILLGMRSAGCGEVVVNSIEVFRNCLDVFLVPTKHCDPLPSAYFRKQTCPVLDELLFPPMHLLAVAGFAVGRVQQLAAHSVNRWLVFGLCEMPKQEKQRGKHRPADHVPPRTR